MKNFVIVLLIVLFCHTVLSATDLNQPLPVDPRVKVGKLSNGLTYYLVKNNTPEHFAELRLVVNAGSVLEDEDQKGLAHFCEHMAFNGTKNFKKTALNDYLSSIGMGFAAGLNAYTSYDETVYILKTPTQNPEHLKKAVFILGEWAHNLSLENSEIKLERGVIVEEWRGRLGAWDKMGKKNNKIIYSDSKYATHAPIGEYEVLSKFKNQRLKQFYQDWYRPDLQAVVVVGDIDIQETEALIKSNFESIPEVKNPRLRENFRVPDNAEPLVTIASDKEATNSRVSLYFKKELKSVKTQQDYLEKIKQELFNSMLTMRLEEFQQKENPPFRWFYISRYPLTRVNDCFQMHAWVNDNGIPAALEAFTRELQRVCKFGFTQGELDRVKLDALKSAERSALDIDKQNSGDLVWDYISIFTRNMPMLNPVQEFELKKSLLDRITLQDVNAVSKLYETDNNVIIAAESPEKPSVKIPTEEELLAVYHKARQLPLLSYADLYKNKPFLTKMPEKGSIVSRKSNKELGLTELVLSNGAKVIYIKTDFKNQQILFKAISPGGISQLKDDEVLAAGMTNELIGQSGLGDFSSIDLTKFLTGHLYWSYTEISDKNEIISGETTREDLELGMQMLYAQFVCPKKDSTSFNIVFNRTKDMVGNNANDPETVYEDSVMAILFNHHPRKKSLDLNNINQVTLDKCWNIYRDRISNGRDFTFVFVGALTDSLIERIAENYLAAIPSKPETEQVLDHQIEYLQGHYEQKIYAGQEEKCQLKLVINSKFPYSYENRTKLKAMTLIFNELLRENVREKLSGVYWVYANPVIDKYPTGRLAMYIALACSPNRVDELTAEIYKVMDSMKKKPAAEKYMKVYLETYLKAHEEGLTNNDYWMSELEKFINFGIDLKELNNYQNILKSVKPTDIQDFAQKYLNYKQNCIKVVLLPKNSL